jgi:ADP-ribosylglycohydrolase
MHIAASKKMGGIWALLCGDAIGVLYEGKGPKEIPALPADLFSVPAAPFARSHPTVLFPAYSDDGARALCLLESLLTHGGHFVAHDDFAQRLLRWYDTGHLAIDGYVFGTGGTTREALARIRSGVPALQAGLTEPTALGNGGLMGVLPLPLWFTGSEGELVKAAMDQCSVTHRHPRVLVTVAAFCLWARYLAIDPGGAHPLDVAALALCELPRFLAPEMHAEVARLVAVLRGQHGPPTGGFNVVETWYSAIECQRESVEATIRAAIQLGNDTDTTAAVAGGIAGVRFGIEGVPAAWRAALAAVMPDSAATLLVVARARDLSGMIDTTDPELWCSERGSGWRCGHLCTRVVGGVRLCDTCSPPAASAGGAPP